MDEMQDLERQEAEWEAAWTNRTEGCKPGFCFRVQGKERDDVTPEYLLPTPHLLWTMGSMVTLDIVALAL